jgi:hypothetical protein
MPMSKIGWDGWIHTSRGTPAEGDRVIVHALLPYFAWYYEGRFYLTLGESRNPENALKFVEWWMPFNAPPPEWFTPSRDINTLKNQLPEAIK